MADRIILDYSSNLDAIIAQEEKYISTLKQTDAELQKTNKTAITGQKELEDLLKRQEANLKKLRQEASKIAPGLDQQKAIENINELNRSINITKSKLKEATSESKNFEKGLGDVGKRSDALNNTLKTVGKTIVAAFAVEKLVSFGKEAVELALKAEGIQIAFDRLNRPELLDDLRKAVSGTVSDVDLMRAAVSANNFNVPLERLGSLFAFASQRASDTGQSVNDLVSNIVDGIGRKSVLVIDNLGISADRVQKEFKKTGDFAIAVSNIIDEEMAKSGESVETVATKVARFNATWENFKLGVGNFLITIGEGVIEFFTDFGDIVTDIFSFDWVNGLINPVQDTGDAIKLTADELERFNTQLAQTIANMPKTRQEAEDLAAGFQQTAEQADALRKATEDAGFVTKETEKVIVEEIVTLTTLRDELKVLQEQYETTNVKSSEFASIGEQIRLKQEEINAILGVTNKELEKQAAALNKVINAQLDESDNLAFLNQQFKNETATIQEAEEAKRKAREETDKEYKEDLERQGEIMAANLKAQEDADKKAAESAERLAQVRRQTVQNGLDVATGALNLIASGQEKNAEFQKKIALFQIGIDTAKAISGVTASALSKGALGVPEYLAILGVILNSIAQANSLVNSQEVPAFADGIVDFKGKGTETSDSNVIKISNRESVIKAKSTKKHKGLLTAINKDDDRAVSDIIMNNYMPKGFAEAIKESVSLNFSTHNVEVLLKDSMKSNKSNTKFLAKVMDKQSKQVKNTNYIQRKQSKL